MLTLTLAILLSAPPATDYRDVRAVVESGMRVVVYAGVPLPKDAPKNAVRVDAIPGEPAGVYDCWRGADGKPAMVARVAAVPAVRAVVAVSAYRDPPGWHRHQCESKTCGFVWSHPDGTPSAGHYCPGCGRYENDKYRGTESPTAKPAPAKPKRISLNGRWYDEYPDGRRVECAT